MDCYLYPAFPNYLPQKRFGENYYWYPVIIGLIITVLGQAIRGATIGLAYIIRGGKDKKVYAEDLVTSGIFCTLPQPVVCWKYFNDRRRWHSFQLIIVCC